MHLLQISNLSCSVAPLHAWRAVRERRTILDRVTLSIGHGEVLGLVGESGSGKSTLARCVAGLQKPDSGAIFFDAINIFPSQENRKLVPLDIQMVFQGSSASLNPAMTIRNCLMEGMTARSRTKDHACEETLDELLSAIGLRTDVLTKLPSELSGGQRQRVAFARALAARPRLLILDEPTSALDLLTQKQILSLLRNLQMKHHLSILFITHDLGVALYACDRIAVLYNGRIVEDTSADLIVSAPQHPFTRRLVADSLLSS